MKKILLAFSVFAVTMLLFESHANAQAGNSSSSRLRHIVIITFKAGASPDSIKALDNVYNDLSKSSFVNSFESGVNVSTRDSGVIKHVYVTTFASKQDMLNYTKIPEYPRLFKISLPISEDVTVADYWIDK